MSLRKAINMGLAKKGATNKELSDYIGFKHPQTITAIKGNNSTSRKTMRKMAEFFGISLKEFEEWAEEE